MPIIKMFPKHYDLLTEGGQTIVHKHMMWARELHTLWNIRHRLIKEIENKKATRTLRGRLAVRSTIARLHYHKSLLFNQSPTFAVDDWFSCYKHTLVEYLETELSFEDNAIFKPTDVYCKAYHTAESGFTCFPVREDAYLLSEGIGEWTEDDTKKFRAYTLRVIAFMNTCEGYFNGESGSPFACRRWSSKVKKISKELYGDANQ